MRKQIILLTLCLVSVLVSVSSVSAADIYVNASASSGGTGTIDNPFQNITDGINLATDGDTVNIADGIYTGAGNTQLTITKSMTITGQSQTGTIIDAQQSGRIFNIASGITVTIQNLTLQNGRSPESGGATLYNLGDLMLNNITFKDNNATEYSSGGAICNGGGANLVVMDSTFTGNNAACGGAIYNGGTLIVSGSNFANNNAIYYSGAVYYGGGAISNYGDLTVTDSSFTENTATNYDGGAIKNCGTITSLTGCTFTENTADNGGAIFNRGSIITDLSGCTFTGNSATYGGAIHNNANSQLTCTKCDFIGNSASHGGAIYNNYATATVIGSNLVSNTASNFGGAFHNYFGDFTLNFNRIVGNTAGREGQDIFNYDNPSEAVNNALYNWWGSNDGPTAGSIEYAQGALVDYDPWLVMTYSADPTTIQQGETSTLTADFRYDSDGTFHDSVLGHLPDGLPVTFTTDLGNVGSKSVVTYTLNGVAIATLRGDEAAGEASTTGTLDDQTSTAPVIINAAGGDDSGNSMVTAEAATSETVGMQETGAPLAGMALAILMVLGGLIGTRKN